MTRHYWIRIWYPLAVVTGFSFLVAAFLSVQLHHLGRVPDHHDALFSIWRLAWFAHQIVIAPARLFDANIFYPEAGTLAYSDATLFQSLLAAPLIWTSIPPVVAYNLLILLSFVAAGSCMFLLVRALTQNTIAAWCAGIIFAFAPYRFHHYIHLELLWTHWMPLTFWALHRTLHNRRLRDGILTGVFAGCQMLSCIYYGIFLIEVVGVACLVLWVRQRLSCRADILIALSACAVTAIMIGALYSIPFRRNAGHLGDRAIIEIASYSATYSDYLASPPENGLYGWTARRWGSNERYLFLGFTAIGLALFALTRPLDSTSLMYLAILVLAFDSSLGMNGLTYAWQHQYVPPVRALRVPARWGAVVVFATAVLAGHGIARLCARARTRLAQAILFVGLSSVLIAEYWVRPPQLVRIQTQPTALSQWLRQQPPSVIVELPLPFAWTLPGSEAKYQYASIFHWQPLVNGYSGYYPPSYNVVIESMRNFPDAQALTCLREHEVRYVVLHPALMAPQQVSAITQALDNVPDVTRVGSLLNYNEVAPIYELHETSRAGRFCQAVEKSERVIVPHVVAEYLRRPLPGPHLVPAVHLPELDLAGSQQAEEQ